jgi:hypothetical protein
MKSYNGELVNGDIGKHKAKRLPSDSQSLSQKSSVAAAIIHTRRNKAGVTSPRQRKRLYPIRYGDVKGVVLGPDFPSETASFFEWHSIVRQ